MHFSFLVAVLPFLVEEAFSFSNVVISNVHANNHVSETHLGIYGIGEHVYRISHLPSDVDDLGNLSSQSYNIITIPDTSRLFYIQEAGVDESLKDNIGFTFADAVNGFVDTLKDRLIKTYSQRTNEFGRGQRTFYIHSVKIIHQTPTSSVIVVPDELVPELDTLLSRFLVLVHIPLDSTSVSVPAESINRVQKWVDALEYNQNVADIVNSISENGLLSDIQYLSGEDPNSDLISRHSFSSDARRAAQWIKAHFEDSGLQCELQSFLIGFSPNVICEYSFLSSVSPTIVLGSHYDSRGRFGSLRAPGANDDGSGTIALLEIARTIKNRGVNFTNANVKFAAFSGEEQGLLGSRAYAQSLREKNVDVAMMIQADMLGYHSRDEPAQLAYTPAVGTIEVAYLIQNVSALYSPELTVGPTTTCCSDHSSFHQEGFAAMQLFERAGPIIDPMYHNSGDLSNREGYDINQIKSIAKVDLAVILHAAGFTINN